MYPGLVFSSTILGGTEYQSCQFFYLFLEVLVTQNYHYAAGVLFLVCLHPNPTGPFCTHVSSICSTAKERKRLEMLPVLRIGMQGLPYQDNSK